MKKPNTLIIMLLSIIPLIYSCAVSQNSVINRHLETKISNQSEQTCFVILKDGSKHYFTSLQMVTGVLMAPHLLADKLQKIYPTEIIAYQSNDQYAVSQELFASGRKSFIAFDALPGFANRIAKGHLNIYTKKLNVGARMIDEYYIQSGDDGPIYAYTKEMMNTFLKDHPDASNYFNDPSIKVPIAKKIMATAALLNANSMISKN